MTATDPHVETWMNQPLTRREFSDFAAALIVALDERKVISLEDLHQSFADTLTRRKVDVGQSEQELHYLQVWLTALHKLASRIRPDKAALP